MTTVFEPRFGVIMKLEDFYYYVLLVLTSVKTPISVPHYEHGRCGRGEQLMT